MNTMQRIALGTVALLVPLVAMAAPADARPSGHANGWTNHVTYVAQCDWVPGTFGIMTPTNCLMVPVKGHLR
jgi:hypothetical protein